MNAHLGAVDVEQSAMLDATLDMDGIMQARLQADKVVINMLMNSLGKSMQAKADVAATSAMNAAFSRFAHQLLRSIGEEHDTREMWDSLSSEDKRMMQKHRKISARATERNMSDDVRKHTSARLKSAWESLSPEAKEERVRALRSWCKVPRPKKIRLHAIPMEETANYVRIKDSGEIAQTFAMKEGAMIKEANRAIARCLTIISYDKGYSVAISSNYRWYDVRAIAELCNGYENRTLSSDMAADLSRFFNPPHYTL